MNGRYFTVGTSTNPVMQVLYLLVGGILLIGALLIGSVILAVVLGFALIFGVAIWLRIWWFRRKLGKTPGRRGHRRDADGEVIEVEYTVVDERKPRERE
jgi:hypothetical protein